MGNNFRRANAGGHKDIAQLRETQPWLFKNNGSNSISDSKTAIDRAETSRLLLRVFSNSNTTFSDLRFSLLGISQEDLKSEKTVASALELARKDGRYDAATKKVQSLIAGGLVAEAPYEHGNMQNLTLTEKGIQAMGQF